MVIAPKILASSVIAVALCAATSPEASQTAVGKLDRIVRAGLESGESITLTEDELNSFLQYDGAAGIPDGIDNVNVSLSTGGGALEAIVDLDQLTAQSDPPFFVKLLMRGTRTVRADVDYAAQGGMATARVVAVAIDDFTLSGAALDWFLDAFAPDTLQPYLSGEPVPLAGNLTEIRVEPSQAVFTAE